MARKFIVGFIDDDGKEVATKDGYVNLAEWYPSGYGASGLYAEVVLDDCSNSSLVLGGVSHLEEHVMIESTAIMSHLGHDWQATTLEWR